MDVWEHLTIGYGGMGIVEASGSVGLDLASIMGQEWMGLRFRVLEANMIELHMRCVGQVVHSHASPLQEWMGLRTGSKL